MIDTLAHIGRCGPTGPQEVTPPSPRSASYAIECDDITLWATWDAERDVPELAIGTLCLWAQVDAEWCSDQHRWGAHVRAWTTDEDGRHDVRKSSAWDVLKGSLTAYEADDLFRCRLQKSADQVEWW